jgi:branched-chain amino acid transport system permease protein
LLQLAILSTLNGILYGILLFLLASGLTLSFSIMGVLNFAHASFYMLGAYLGFQINQVAGFWVALLAAPVLVGGLGAVIERWGLRAVQKRGHGAELLFTFGLAIVIEEFVQMVWGKLPVDYRVPAVLNFHAFEVLGITYPAFRVFMLLMALGIFLLLFLVLTRSRLGLIIRAALTHPQMVSMLGHDVPKVFMLVFGAGCGLAGLAGVVAGPLLVTQPSMANTLGSILFVVVVFGGLGSLPGAFIASLTIGLIQTFAVSIDYSLGDALAGIGVGRPTHGVLRDIYSVPVAQVGPLIPYLMLVLVLIFRPTGLMGARET